MKAKKELPKKISKKFWKRLDKREKMWYNKEVVRQERITKKASWKLNNQEYENPWKYFE